MSITKPMPAKPAKPMSLAEKQRQALAAVRQMQEQDASGSTSTTTSAPAAPSTQSGKIGMGSMGSAPGLRTPVTAPGLAAGMQAELERLRKLTSESQILNLPLDRLVEVPGRRRVLTSDAYNQLKLSLKDPRNLNHPIRATPCPEREGYYEVISGHNRLHIFREHGHDTIPSYIDEIDPDQIQRMAFFANLMQTELSDYEKYVGFSQELAATGVQQQELAEAVGFSKGYISKVLCYGSMPTSFHAVLATNPHALPVKQAYPLVQKYRNQPKQLWDSLLPSLNALAQGDMDLSTFVQAAEHILGRKSAAPARSDVVRLGLARALNRSTGKRLVLEFTSSKERERYEEAILKRLDGFQDSEAAPLEPASRQASKQAGKNTGERGRT